MISSSHKICFLFYSFLFFSPFTFDPFYSYKHTEKVNKICDAKNLPTSSHSNMNIQNFLKETCKSVHDSYLSYLYILIGQPNDKEPYFY